MTYLSELKGRVIQDKDGEGWLIHSCKEFEPTDTDYLHGSLNLENVETGEAREVDLMISSSTPQERFGNLRSVIEVYSAEIINAAAPVVIRLSEGGGGGIYIPPVMLN